MNVVRFLAITVLCLMGLCLLLLADHVGQQRRCDHLTPGSYAWSVYCEPR